MSLLLLQSAYSLIVHHDEKGPANDIDVIVRTASASIFGYFLSANFMHRESIQKEHTDTDPEQEVTAQMVEPEEEPRTGSGQFQILVAAGIGLFCLTLLILLRNVPGWGSGVEHSASTSATVAQFRDFVSGCVGFLIGSPTRRN